MIMLPKKELAALVQQVNNMISFKYQTKKNITLSEFLLSKGYSDSNIFYLIKNCNIVVNNEVITDRNYVLSDFNNVVKVTLNDESNDIPVLDKPLDIIYEDDYIMIINKPYDIDIEPTKGNYNNTLANVISYYYSKNNIKSKIHFVNRLDKLTSGLVIVAKNQYIHNLFSNVKITKKYHALVSGLVDNQGSIKIKIEKEENSVKRIVSSVGKACITNYKLVNYDGTNSLVDIELVTGRTHQIRVSFEYIGHPLVNDPLYGTIDNQNGMYLCAYNIRFKHPITKKEIDIEI